MTGRVLRCGLAALTAVIVLGLRVPAAAQGDEGVKQIERLVKASGNTVKAIAETKQQLAKTMDVYNALMAEDAKDRKKLYADLKKQMGNTEKRRSQIAEQATSMKSEAEALFRQWAESAAAIENAELRARSEERLEATKTSYAEIDTVGRKAADLYHAFMKDLQDQITFLGHDLNPEAVASLGPEAEELNEKADTLMRRIDDTIRTANERIGALRP